MKRQLWIDTRGEPVITTTPNGVRNAKHWGWVEAVAVPQGAAPEPEWEWGAALAAIERVDALHVESDWKCGNPRHTNPEIGCPECYTECETCDRTYPCDTRAALDGALEEVADVLGGFAGTILNAESASDIVRARAAEIREAKP